MLSNPPPCGLPPHPQHRQQQQPSRQHRRQNSTPTGFEAIKAQYEMPDNASSLRHRQQQHHQQQQRQRFAHRRGLSLDTRRQQMQASAVARQDHPAHHLASVSNTNNTGINNPQHVLREAQQQRIARPGPQQAPHGAPTAAAYANLATDDSYLMSPHGTPQIQSFDGQCYEGMPQMQPGMEVPFHDMTSSPVHGLAKKDLMNSASQQDFDLFPCSNLSTPTYVSFQDSPTGAPGWMSEGDSRRSSRRISGGIMDRVVKFETMGSDGPQRPLTPPAQNAPDYFPLTPMETPHDRTIKHHGPQRFSQTYDESMEETIKPIRQHPAHRRTKSTFDDMRQVAESQSQPQHQVQLQAPVPSRANTMPMANHFEQQQHGNEFLAIPKNNNDNGMTIQTRFDGVPGPAHPLSSNPDLSHYSTPITPHMGDFNSSFEDVKSELHSDDFVDALSLPGDGSQSTEKPSRRGSPHRRTESVASMASAASIASIDIEKTKLTTGITMDDIHQYISGPDPKDNKWVCVFEDCNKKFGRKENIKSHVQTHLNDRQYRCPTCNKCFVRQHDLKRHAKIHTGIKPYPCECGNSFARHDALTRHKQRGMCIGAFDGVVRKVVKRGRPRKNRPDMDERQDKSSRTRRKNHKSTGSSASSISMSGSSQSGYSDSSALNSPETFETDFESLDDIMDVSMGGTTMNPSSLQGMSASSAPMPSLGDDEPSAANSNVDSPSAGSVHSYVSQLSQISLQQVEEAVASSQHSSASASSHPGSPAKSIASHYNEPPELSRSSSPPGCTQFFDLDPNSSGTDGMLSTASESTSSNNHNNHGLPNLDQDDILLQFTHNDPNMLMLSSSDGSKFDEAFGDSVDMFTNNDDLFFGSS